MENQKNKNMLTAKYHKKNSVSSIFKPVLPLVPESFPKTDTDKALYISMDLKNQAGVDTSGIYRKNIPLFEEGTPQDWINC